MGGTSPPHKGVSPEAQRSSPGLHTPSQQGEPSGQGAEDLVTQLSLRLGHPECSLRPSIPISCGSGSPRKPGLAGWEHSVPGCHFQPAWAWGHTRQHLVGTSLSLPTEDPALQRTIPKAGSPAESRAG